MQPRPRAKASSARGPLQGTSRQLVPESTPAAVQNQGWSLANTTTSETAATPTTPTTPTTSTTPTTPTTGRGPHSNNAAQGGPRPQHIEPSPPRRSPSGSGWSSATNLNPLMDINWGKTQPDVTFTCHFFLLHSNIYPFYPTEYYIYIYIYIYHVKNNLWIHYG